MESNQFTPKLESKNIEGEVFHRLSLLDGEDEIFSTSLIPDRYADVAALVHQTLQVSISFGLLNRPRD